MVRMRSIGSRSSARTPSTTFSTKTKTTIEKDIITFAGSIPGETQTLPLAIYAALQTPGGEMRAAQLSMVSIILALAGLTLADFVGRGINRRLGRGG